MEKYTDKTFKAGFYVPYFDEIFSQAVSQLDLSGKELLEIGCGNGEQIFSFADKYSDLAFTGIDVSHENIKLCQSNKIKREDQSRFDFICDDFLRNEFNNKKFDIVFSYSVLQLIDSPFSNLLNKIRNVLNVGGYLILSMPYVCTYNHFIGQCKKIIGRIRSDMLDQFIVNLAYHLYHKKYSKDFLNERLIYLDQVNYNCMDMRHINALQHEWHLEIFKKTPSPSFIQDRHMTVILKKI